MSIATANAPDAARPRLPWALFGAIALMLAFEVALRATGFPRKLPYDLGLAEYNSLAAELNRRDPAEVVFVGSSRTRESIHLPTLEPILSKAVGRKVSVASYALSRARAFDFESVIRRVLRSPHPPKVILCGVSERDLARGISNAFDTAPVLWNWGDWKYAWDRRGGEAMDALPVVVRNEVGGVWRTLQMREMLRMKLADLGSLETPDKTLSPIEGGSTVFQKTEHRKSLAEQPRTREYVLKYIKDLHLSPYPDPEMIKSLDGMIRSCREKNVQLILYEVPVPTIFRRNLPKGLYEKYLSILQTSADKGGVRFVRVDELPVSLGNYQFREQSHMNLRGARGYSVAIGETVIAQALGGTVTKTEADAAAKAAHDADAAAKRKKRKAADRKAT